MTDMQTIYKWVAEEHGHILANCPECDKPGTLAKGTHTVRTNGEVVPSFICPHCGWHGWVRLRNWPSASEVDRG